MFGDLKGVCARARVTLWGSRHVWCSKILLGQDVIGYNLMSTKTVDGILVVSSGLSHEKEGPRVKDGVCSILCSILCRKASKAYVPQFPWHCRRLLTQLVRLGIILLFVISCTLFGLKSNDASRTMVALITLFYRHEILGAEYAWIGVANMVWNV